MKKILFISNITRKITSFSSSSIYAAHKMGMKFIHAANWSETPKEQIESLEKENDIIICNVPISRSPFSLSNIEAFKQLCRVVEENKIEYIHCNTPVGGLLGRLVGKKCNVKKVIYQAHGFHFYKGAPKKNWLLYYPIEKWLAHYTDALITINQEDYELAKNKVYLRNDGKIYYVPGVGIDLENYIHDNNSRIVQRRELGVSDTDVVFISMGDLIQRKNYSVAIEAISKCNNPNIKYWICGKGSEEENLEEQIKKLNLENQVFLLGYRSDIKELLNAADCFLFTSLQEGLPRSTMEAMAAGLPCVISKIRGNIDLIEEGRGGYLCDPHSSNEFSEVISKLANDTALREKMSCYNLKEIKKYSLDNVSGIIEDIYRREYI